MTPFAIIALIEAIIQLTPEAIALWQLIRPILEEGREPTIEEWAALNRQADAVHGAVQTRV